MMGTSRAFLDFLEFKRRHGWAYSDAEMRLILCGMIQREKFKEVSNA